MQNEEKRKQELESTKKRERKSIRNSLIEEFIEAMKISEEDECPEEDECSEKDDEETESYIGRLKTLNAVITIIILVVSFAVTLNWTYNRGYTAGYEEVNNSYKKGVRDGASIMGVYTLSLTTENVSEEKKHEVEEWFYEMIIDPDSENISEFIKEFLEELYGISVEIDL